MKGGPNRGGHIEWQLGGDHREWQNSQRGVAKEDQGIESRVAIGQG